MYEKVKCLSEAPFKDYINIKKLNLILKVKPYYTMVSYQGLSNIYELVVLAEKNKTEGCLIECGVWRGGCAAVMAQVVQRFRSKRKIWLFDSFKGLPEPTKKDDERLINITGGITQGRLKSIDICAASRNDVIRLFHSLKLYTDNIMIQEGWFQDILPKFKDKVGPIAILRLDCDLYESTKCCLENLYRNVIPGGYVVIDDYDCWNGCKKATDGFLTKEKIDTALLKKIGGGCYYFQKPL